MRASTITAVAACLIGSAVAAPVSSDKDSRLPNILTVRLPQLDARQGLFDGISGATSGILGAAQCLVGGFFGSAKESCGHYDANTGTSDSNGSAPPAPAASTSYSYSFDTNGPNSLIITIIPDDGSLDSCTYAISTNGRTTKEVVKEAADRCL